MSTYLKEVLFHCSMKGWVSMDALSNIRIEIDHIDRELIRLLAQRQILVEKAGRLKPKGDKSAVRANDRVAQVIANRRKEALELGLSPDVAESVWRSMIKAFIALEEKVNKEQ
jgi:isochorismate pyruvate lyase